MSDRLTKAQWLELRDQCFAGLKAVAANRSYSIDGVSYSRENLDSLAKLLEYCEEKIAGFEGEGGGVTLQSVVPV